MKKKKDEKEESFKEEIIPSVRIYVSITNLENDQLEIPEIMDIAGEKGISEFIRELIDNGHINVYLCCFDKVMKVI